MVVSGYRNYADWRSLRWALDEYFNHVLHLGWTRSFQDIFNLWFRRDIYVRKYHPELIND
jgi:hypothetical protein